MRHVIESYFDSKSIENLSRNVSDKTLHLFGSRLRKPTDFSNSLTTLGVTRPRLEPQHQKSVKFVVCGTD